MKCLPSYRQRRPIRGLITAIALASFRLNSSAGADISSCWSPSPEMLEPGVRREWILFGSGNVSDANNFFPICSLDNVKPEDPPGVLPLYLAPRAVDQVFIGSSRKGMDAKDWPTAELGPLVGTITLDGSAYRDVVVWPLTKDDLVILQVPGTVSVDGFSFIGLPDASNFSIGGIGTVSAQKFGVLGGVDVFSAIGVTNVPQAGSLLTTPDLTLLSGNILTKSGDILIAGGANSVGALSIPDSAEGQLRRLDVEYGSQSLFVARDGVGSFSLGANSQVTAGVLVIGAERQAVGTVVVHPSAELLVNKLTTSSINVGGKGVGQLTLQEGAVVRSSGDMIVASGVTGQGKVEMQSGSELSLGVNPSGAGALRIGGYDKGFGAGGKAEFQMFGGKVTTKNLVIVGASESSSGKFTFFNEGELNLERRLIVGHAGEGQMLVQGEAHVTINHPDGDEGLRIGRWETGVGQLTLSGPNARIDGLGKLATVGLLGKGSLVVEEGFKLQMDTGTIVLGQEAGAVGALNVDGIGSELKSSELKIGDRGTGQLRVTDGAVVKTDVRASFGEGAGPAGRISTALVDGPGSRWEIGGGRAIQLGPTLMLGGASEGRLTIQNGAVVELKGLGQSGTLSIADAAGSQGTLRLDGANSRLNTTGLGGGVIIGGGGEATVEVVNGAQLNLGGTSSGNGIELGRDATAKSTILVQDRGAKVDVAGPLSIGIQGTGELLVKSAAANELATLRATGPLMLGVQGNGKGAANIEGPGAVLQVGASVTIGDRGYGELHLLRGGKLEMEAGLLAPRQVTLAKEPLSTGLLELSGGELHATRMDVGIGGHGELQVNAGGNLTVDDVLQVGGFDPVARGIAEFSGEATQITAKTLDIGRRKTAVFGQTEPSLHLDNRARLKSTDTRIGADGSASYRVGGAAIWEPGTVRIGGLDVAKTVGLVSGSHVSSNSFQLTAIGDNELTLDQGAKFTPTLLAIGREGRGQASLTLKGFSHVIVPENRTLIGADPLGTSALNILEGSLFESSELIAEHSTITIDGNQSKLSAGSVLLNQGSRVAMDHGGSLFVEDFIASGGDTRITLRHASMIQADRLAADFLEVAEESVVKVPSGIDVGSLLLTDQSRIEFDEAMMQRDSVWKVMDRSSVIARRHFVLHGPTTFLEVGEGSRVTAVEMLVLSDGLVHGSGAQLSSQSLRVNAGKVDFTQGAQGNARDLFLLNGTVHVAGGSKLSLSHQLVGAGTFDRLDVRGGSATIGAASPVTNAVVVGPGGTIAGDLQVIGDLIVSGGTVAPGQSPGQIRVEGDLTVQQPSVFNIEFAGSAEGEFDRVEVTGDLHLDTGTVLNLSFIEGYAPSAGDTINFLHYGAGLTGSFRDVTVSGLEAGWRYQLDVQGDGNFMLHSLSDGVPTTVASLPGDFNHNGVLDSTDINQLTTESAIGTNDPRYDLNEDQAVDAADVTVWVKNLKKSWMGDANLDGEFNSSDFVQVFTVGKYEQNQATTWTEGDWDANGLFNTGDFVLAFQDGGYEQGARPVNAAVPEPSSWWLLFALPLWKTIRPRHRASR